MKKELREDKLFTLYLDTVTELEKFLWLDHFEISMQGRTELWADASMDINYKYFRGTLLFDNKIIYNEEHIKETDFHEIARLFMHELFHIFCSVWSTYLTEEWDNIKNRFSQNELALHNNAMITLEEQMVVTLEKNFIKVFEKTKEYEVLEKRFIDLKR